MNIKNETKWRRNYYRETEKAIRYYEFLNQKSEIRIRKITDEEKRNIEIKLQAKPNPFALKLPVKRRKKNGWKMVRRFSMCENIQENEFS